MLILSITLLRNSHGTNGGGWPDFHQRSYPCPGQHLLFSQRHLLLIWGAEHKIERWSDNKVRISRFAHLERLRSCMACLRRPKHPQNKRGCIIMHHVLRPKTIECEPRHRTFVVSIGAQRPRRQSATIGV